MQAESTTSVENANRNMRKHHGSTEDGDLCANVRMCAQSTISAITEAAL